MIKSLCFLALVGYVAAIPVDNGVEGDPEIACGPTSIGINFITRNPFEGHVYVKGSYAEDACRNDAAPSIELPFDSCGVVRTRSLNPKGVFVSITVIISFHPLFITKVDRAYKIQCFYMEADKTVSTEIEVSMLTTDFRTEVVPMPICRYEILDGGPEGPPVLFAIVGQQVYHKWTCDTETIDTFCMVVHSCFVDDGNGDRVDLLDTDGCAVDRYLINNLEYPTDLMAGQEAHVFKYADRPQLFFQCQITVTVKEPNAACILPQCAPPPGRGGGGRKRRQVAFQDNAGTWDVRTGIETLDIDDHTSAVASNVAHRPPTSLFRQEPIRIASKSQGICISTTGFTVLIAFGIALLVAVITVGTCLATRTTEKVCE
jgi:hypothetical protein